MTEEDKTAMMNKIEYGDTIAHLKDVDFVVEAASEDFNLKKVIFQHLAENTKEGTILASNTSSISITKIGGVIAPRAH